MRKSSLSLWFAVALCCGLAAACDGCDKDSPTAPSRPDPPKTPTGAITGVREIDGKDLSIKLVFTVTQPDGTSNDQTINAEWVSSNTTVARVYRGTVTSYGYGSADISASYQGVSARVTVTVVRRGITFKAVSNGQAIFYKDGTAFHTGPGYNGGWRGFNIAAINSANGELLHPVKSFDTWAGRTSGTEMRRMIDYINGLPDRTLLLIAVSDEAGLNDWSSCSLYLTRHNEDGIKLLESLGSTLIRGICYRSSWSMIAVKGEGKKDEKVEKIGLTAESVFLLPL